MIAKELKNLLKLVDDDVVVRLNVTDENYDQHIGKLTTYEVDEGFLTLQAEE